MHGDIYVVAEFRELLQVKKIEKLLE